MSKTVRGGAIALAILLFLPTAPAAATGVPAGDTEDAASAREAIDSLLEEGDWKAATKAIKSYRRQHAKTDEARAEADRLAAHAKGGADLDKIEQAYRKKGRPRSTARKLDRFRHEYRGIDVLTGRAEELQDAARSEYVLVLEDFEERKGEEDDGSSRSGRLTIVTDDEMVKHGRRSGRWNAGGGWSSFGFESPVSDLSEYDYFCAWIYNARGGERPGHIRIDANAGGEHYFSYFLAIDWTGWREIRMPLRGRTSQFGRHGTPEWSAIEYFDFYHDDDSATRVEIIVDDIRLEKHTK